MASHLLKASGTVSVIRLDDPQEFLHSLNVNNTSQRRPALACGVKETLSSLESREPLKSNFIWNLHVALGFACSLPPLMDSLGLWLAVWTLEPGCVCLYWTFTTFSCVTLGKLPNLSEHQYSHMSNGDNN